MKIRLLGTFLLVSMILVVSGCVSLRWVNHKDSLADFNVDKYECHRQAMNAAGPIPPPPSGDCSGAGSYEGGFACGMARSAPRNDWKRAVEQLWGQCLAAKGWTQERQQQ